MNELSDRVFIFDHDGTILNTSVYPRKVNPIIKKILNFVQQRKIPLYIWTARDRQSLNKLLLENKLNHLFSGISTQEDGFKPDTTGIRQLIGDQKSILIGDSRSDMVGGKELGAFCIGVCWTSKEDSIKIDLKKFGADIVFDEPKDLLAFIEEKLGE